MALNIWNSLPDFLKVAEGLSTYKHNKYQKLFS